MDYKELINFTIEYGHGVFTITMMEAASKRHSLKMWIYRHRELFDEYRGTNGDLKILVINDKGYEYFGKKQKKIKASTWETLSEYALINSYLWENNLRIKYKNVPHFRLDTGTMIIGINSQRFGPSFGLKKIDKYISCPKALKNCLLDKKLIEEIAKKENISVDLVLDKLENSCIPKSFCWNR